MIGIETFIATMPFLLVLVLLLVVSDFRKGHMLLSGYRETILLFFFITFNLIALVFLYGFRPGGYVFSHKVGVFWFLASLGLIAYMSLVKNKRVADD